MTESLHFIAEKGRKRRRTKSHMNNQLQDTSKGQRRKRLKRAKKSVAGPAVSKGATIAYVSINLAAGNEIHVTVTVDIAH